MNKTEQVLKVYEDVDGYNVVWMIDRNAPVESITNILCSVLETAIKAIKGEGVSNDEIMRLIVYATFCVVKDAGIADDVDAFVVSKKAKNEE